MKLRLIFTIHLIVLVFKAFEGCVNAAQVNIDLSKFQNGTLTIPENSEEGEIPVTFSEAVKDTQVNVTCTINSKPELLVTDVEFSTVTVAIGSTTAKVAFSINEPGSAVLISCFGKSEGSNNLQFNGSASAGNTGKLRVTRAPSVVIKVDTLLVPPYVQSSSIEVHFSEKIVSLPVVVECATLPVSTGVAPLLQLEFSRTVVQVGQTKKQVAFSVLSHGAAVQVVCQAQTSRIIWASSSPVPQAQTATPSQTIASSAGSITASASPAAPVRRRRSDFVESSENVTEFQYRYSTSAGPPVMVTLGPPALRILPQGGVLRGVQGVFYALLLGLDEPADGDLELSCYLTLLEVGAKLNTTGVCPAPVPLPTAVTLSNGTITLQLQQVSFEAKEIFKSMELRVSGRAAERVRDLVQVTCCCSRPGTYQDESAVAHVWVDLSPERPVNWEAVESGKRASTQVADINLDCPCNLKEASCDVGCCCDTTDCSPSELEKVTCIPGFFGGAKSERPFEFGCDATWPDATDWSPVLCVTTNNSPFYGYFFNFTSPPSAQTSEAFNALSSGKAEFDFTESEERTLRLRGEAYTAGSIIMTAPNSQTPLYLGVLSLPGSPVSGLCSPAVPVRFGEDVHSQCVIPLDESVCGADTFSAYNYLLSRDLSPQPALLPAAVLRDGTLSSTPSVPPKFAKTDVRYFYAPDPSRSVAMTTNVPAGNSGASSLFSTGSGNETESDQPDRCDFDDTETLPPTPAFDETSRVCSDVVLSVKYELTWRGQEILGVRADIFLGDVVIPKGRDDSRDTMLATSQSSAATVTQTFDVTFIHSPLEAQNYSTPQAPRARSGNPGYIRDLPVLWRTVEETSGNVSSGQLSMWSPGFDGLCAGSSQAPVLFGQGSSSGCLLRLTLHDMRNCSQLRLLLWTNQERLIQASQVGRRGNANLRVNEDWIPILREESGNLSTMLDNSSQSTEVGTCQGLPAMLRAEILISEAGKYQGAAQMEVVGVKVTYDYATWRFKCVSGDGVSCSAPVPTATNASGTGNATNTTEREYGSRFQYFAVMSTVAFIDVPHTDPPRVKRSADTTGICYEDVCRHELFFPLTAAYQGESRDLVLIYSLVLILFALCTFAVTRPWG